MPSALRTRVLRAKHFRYRVGSSLQVAPLDSGSKMFEFDAALSTAVEIKQKPGQAVKLSEPAKPSGPLPPALLDRMHRYWFAANYLCVGQIYLLDNPLLREPLRKENIKPRLLGHWGTSADQILSTYI